MIEIIFALIITVIAIRATLTTVDKKSDTPTLIKKKRYFTKENELGVYYEEDENGKITKLQDGQHY